MSRFALVLILTSAIAAVAAPHRAGASEASSASPQYKYTSLSAPFQGVTSTLGYGINDFGDVVGSYQANKAPIGYPPDIAQHGFVLKRGTYTTIDVPFAGATDTVASGINNLGDVVGTYSDSDGYSHGFTLKKGVFTSFDFPGPDVVDTTASAINVAGAIVGYYYDLNSQQRRGFIFKAGKFSSIDPPFTDACCTRALGINDRGEIVGDYLQGYTAFGFTRKQGKFQSFDWSFPADFPDPYASENALPSGSNNHGDIVGLGFRLSQGNFTPFSDMDLGFSEASGNGINDQGEIVGNILQNGLPKAGFLLIPVSNLTQ
jgi:probable HAF family extracellular repeat protein